MIRHVVLFRWKEGTSEGEVASALDALAGLPAAIPTVRAFAFGADAGLADGNWDVAVTADFADEAGYVAYRDHPAHRAVVAEAIVPIVAHRAAVQVHVEG